MLRTEPDFDPSLDQTHRDCVQQLHEKVTDLLELYKRFQLDMIYTEPLEEFRNSLVTVDRKLSCY